MGRIRQLEHHNRSCDPFHPKIQPSPRRPHLQVACSPDLWTTSGVVLSQGIAVGRRRWGVTVGGTAVEAAIWAVAVAEPLSRMLLWGSDCCAGGRSRRNDTVHCPRTAKRPQISNHGDSAAGIFFAAPHCVTSHCSTSRSRRRAALLLTAPPFTEPFLTGRPRLDLPRRDSFTPIPRLTCSDIAYRSYVSAECKDDQITKEPNMRTRNIFEPSPFFYCICHSDHLL
jgi:hypothetical protein